MDMVSGTTTECQHRELLSTKQADPIFAENTSNVVTGAIDAGASTDPQLTTQSGTPGESQAAESEDVI